MIDRGVCGRERPDRVYETPRFVLIVECDEGQHEYRNCACEQTRMVNIGMSYGGKQVLFLRFNPDEYEPLHGNQVPLKKRREFLGDLIRDILEERVELPQDALVSAAYLYFDGFSGQVEWEAVLAMETESAEDNKM
jgi:hypothetical protein